MVCSKCGWNNKPKEQFCINCGSQLITKTPAQNSHAGKNGRPAKSLKGIWIALGSIALVFVLAVCLGFLFRLQIMKALMPENYLQFSMGRTVSSLLENEPSVFDLSRYSGEPAAHSFAVDADFVNLDGSFKCDNKNEKALLDVDVAGDWAKFGNMQLFISSDLLAVSIPDLVWDVDYLTADPATFADKWAEQGLDEYASVPDLEKMIHSLFGKSVDKDNNVIPQKDAREILKDLYTKADFSVNGSIEETVGTEKMRLDVLTYTFSEASVNTAYKQYVSLLKEKSFADCNLNIDNYSNQIGSIFDELEALKVKGDVAVRFYVDKDAHVRKIVADKFAVAWDDMETDCSAAMDLVKIGPSTENITVLISTETAGVTGDASIVWKSSYSNGVYTGNLASEGEAIADMNAFSMSADAVWNSKDTSEENLDIHILAKDNYSTIDMLLKGILKDGEKETSLSASTFEMKDKAGKTTKINFDYAVQPISASEIKVDTSDSTPLLEYQPFLFLLYMKEAIF